MINELASCPLFADLDRDSLSAIQDEIALLGVPSGQVLFAQGDAADGLYIVLQGRLRSMTSDGRVLGEIGPVGYVGEMAMLTGGRRSATVVALRDSTLGRLSRGSFGRLMLNSPSVVVDLARTIAARAQSNTAIESGLENFTTICMITRSPEPAAADFEQRFLAEFTKTVRTVAVGSTELPSRAGAAGAAGAAGIRPDHNVPPANSSGAASTASAPRRLVAEDAAWFDTIETASQHVLYLCDPNDQEWTALCVRRADLVLVVTTPGMASDSGMPELPSGTSTLACSDLVMVHGTTIAGGAADVDLQSGRFRRVHHARAGRIGDIQRLVRLLTGRATGLALSGGARRGAAHVGVLRALQESGTCIDMIAGTSAGAIVGAMAALEFDWREALEHVHHLGRMRAWRDLGPPIVSLLSGQSFSVRLRHIFGDVALEDSPIPLLAVCAAIDCGESFVPDRGPLWLSLRASASLPGIFAPVPWQGHLLMDGALVENLPVEVLRARCPTGRLIASDVGAPSLNTDLPADLHSTSGWRLLASRYLAPHTRPTRPGIVDLMISAACVTSTRRIQQTRDGVDCYIASEVGDHADLSRRQGSDIDVMAQRGYQAALRALEAEAKRTSSGETP